MSPTKQLRIVEQRELIIATACGNLATELRSLDPTTYALFFNTGNMSAIYEAITEMIERHFARGNNELFMHRRVHRLLARAARDQHRS